ncbi:hypothetical protein ASPCAL04125 [Aspergillus calidoustus]|uniref:Uncharacterized protein n=1 Tax=Aspergillus calidoustus TaxID=454130 RepID=A0A0U5GQA6_ASPCI|nr:hypothetical protein ASPCAL04125 [Aspergillus calidoustus]
MLEIQGYDGSHCTMKEIVPYSYPVWPHRVRHVWFNMVRIFRNLPPILDEGGVDSILENSQALVELGEDILASEVVSRALNTAFHNLDQQMYRLIAQDPIAWVKLAVHIQSGPIFQESMIHLLGKWGQLEEKERDLLPADIRNICKRKIEDLNSIKKAVELQIVNHVPRPRLATTRYREASNAAIWMVLTYYHQWLSQAFAEGRNFRARDGGAAFYRAIAGGGDTYLNKIEQEVSHFAFTEIGDEGRELESDLTELKRGIKGVVSDLLVNHAKYDPEILGELPYLTCYHVGEEEMPPKPAETVKFMYPAAEKQMTHEAGNFANANLEQNFFNDPMSNGVQVPMNMNMVGYNGIANNFYPTNGTQNHSSFDGTNLASQHWGSNWSNTVDYSDTTPQLPMASLSDMTTAVYQTQLDHNGNFDEIDVFGIVPTTETGDYSQTDDGTAFI